MPKTIADAQVLMRTMSAADFAAPCACAQGTPIVAKLAFYVVPADSWPYPTGTYHIRVTVRPPWHVGLAKESDGCASTVQAQCQDLKDPEGSDYTNLQVWTQDPTAPPVNVEIAAGDCPK